MSLASSVADLADRVGALNAGVVLAMLAATAALAFLCRSRRSHRLRGAFQAVSADDEEAAALELKNKRTFRKYTYRGIDLDNLLDLTPEQQIDLVHARARRRNVLVAGGSAAAAAESALDRDSGAEVELLHSDRIMSKAPPTAAAAPPKAAEAWLGGRRRPGYRSAPSVLLKTDCHAINASAKKVAVSAAALPLSMIDSDDDDDANQRHCR